MDKNTLVGFLLIIAIFIGFYWYTKPTSDQMDKRKAYSDSIYQSQVKNIQEGALTQAKDSTAKTDTVASKIADTYGAFAPFSTGEENFVVLENEKIKVKLTTKGGRIYSVELKEYKTHDQKPLILFDGKDSKTNFTFITANNRIVNSDELYFTPITANKGNVIMRLALENGKYIDFKYVLPDNDYMVHFDIQTKGMEDVLSKSSNVLDMEWNVNLRQQEKGKKFENRYAGLQYKFVEDDDIEQLKKDGDDTKDVANRLQWIACKDQFFSSILIADDYFYSATLKSKMSQEGSSYLKDCHSTMSVNFDPKGEVKTGFRYYFGANKYRTFKSYDKALKDKDKLHLDKLVPLGWGIFGWVNKFLVIPVFNFLEKFISNYGIIILLMTIFIKLILLPLTFKSYMSTAKMKVLRPQIDEINAKIPAEKAMERQQATMNLYKKVGVSPMGGCLPMLLQMPILFAMFTFFPASIELRQQSFLWAKDLSTFDAIISWDKYIPIISTYYGNHVSLFCLLMTVTNIIYTKINSDATAGSSQQMPGMKVVMYLMPLMFLVFFNEYSSGLSYYYFISTLFTIFQTYLFRAFVNEKKLLLQLNENKKKPAKKSKFADKLEKMQKQQLEMQKQQRNRK